MTNDFHTPANLLYINLSENSPKETSSIFSQKLLWTPDNFSKSRTIHGLEQPYVIKGCGADFCDSQHDVNTHCPATVTQDIAKLVIQCRITSKQANISNTSLTFASFSRLILTEHAMKITSAQIPMLEFRNHINEVLRYYADNGVTWQISGWYKPRLCTNDE
ncbi:hypothetical protein E2C01_071563 [Portunus trituberculatus]|uniref:Uncharacterized protein n=1 Tax=Portunus trituberculatus TaxID=210409 RepID=A0A5B7I8B5_PORTR|nr:hypothetical protein [Portunus trituberculatus]